MRSLREGRFGTGALIYAAFVVYGSLVPLAWRYRPLAEAWQAFQQTPYLQLGLGSRADWVANILLYIPLAFLLSGFLAPRIQKYFSIALAFGACAVLAVAVEFAQLYFPPRTVSLNDILAELIGTGAGIALWHGMGARLLGLWDEVRRHGQGAARALTALYSGAYLAFSLFPYDFIVSASELALKLATPGRLGLFVTDSCGSALPCTAKLFAEVLTAAPLGAFLGMLSARGTPPRIAAAFGWGVMLGAVIEGLQTFLASGVTQGASVLTRGAGVALGLAVQRYFRAEWLNAHRGMLRFSLLFAVPAYAAALAAVNGFFSARLESAAVAAAKLRELRFLPFYYHYFTSETQALHSLLVHAGGYAPVGLMVWILRGGKGERAAPALSALAAAALATAVEAAKLFVAGRRPDPTNVLIGAAAAALACLALSRLAHSQQPPQEHRPPPRMRRRAWRRLSLAAAALASLASLAGWVIAIQPREHFVDETKLRQLPAPLELAPVALPGFRTAHPRLPSPTSAELAILARHNPGFMAQLAQRAAGGHGDLEAAALQAVAAPGSVDLELLHARLLSLKFSWRGHGEVKPLALAYDWLHARWSEEQRARLRAKLADGCDYLIDFIRRDRLSPYNVYLYNAPLQALMACSIALYRDDDPRGELAMRFTHDLWKNRVLPAWRQVMGHAGGWHEGGEYVGIGIGQAIWQLPAMWRAATGEDLIAREPGIRGFLDFLVYRTQPDGTHFRWGDGAWFNRAVPDALPLALELKHAAAYTMQRPPAAVAPSGWPWGPLTDPSLADARAQLALPLARHFDGLGLVVARSDWSPQATYVTFKAGDNYWSHSHLDQGAFTIYKGGPLAIDSGLYGPGYGSDHHMNYTYQAIAHNTITVTDPADTVPAPGEEKLRPIANDGGQRRVGSGWGVEAAPIDRAEWEEKRATYHTGELQKFFDGDALAIAVADVTPAYTNARSGLGTFSHRTRRVERFWRVLGYDREDDVVVVFDQVSATNAAFRKRWLLHTVDEPQVGRDGFRVTGLPQNRAGRAGGRLEAKVLLPKGAVINAVGGPGLEFLVDDKNYDEGGKLREALKRLQPGQSEPGAWRVELMPPEDANDDLFLVVLLPTLLDRTPSHSVRLIESDGRVGCEVAGPSRTTRWWFKAGENGVEVEVLAGGEIRRHSVLGKASSPPRKPGWFDRLVRDSSN